MKIIGRKWKIYVSSTYSCLFVTALVVELKEPEFSERVAKFKKEHQHEIALNKSRDTNRGQQFQAQQFHQPDSQGPMGPPGPRPKRMPTELNRNNPGNIDPKELNKKKIDKVYQ